MITKMMKYAAIVTLVVAALLWSYAAAYERILGFVVSLGAFLVALQALRAHKRGWAAGFLGIALLFNPFLPIGAFAGYPALVLLPVTMALFASSLYTLKTQPLLSMPSITNRTPGSQSL